MLLTNRNFLHFHGSQFAAALSYGTLLSIIPIAAFLFFLSLQTEVFSSIFIQVREQVLLQLIPTSRSHIESYLIQTSQNIKTFSYFGVAVVFSSAIFLSLEIERALNHIWQVKAPRNLALRIPAHIIIWLFTPLLIMLSITATTWFTSLPYLSDIDLQISSFSHMFPWLVSSVALFLLYYFVPNTKVYFTKALVSALFSGLLFEMSKWAFAFYITEIAVYTKLYGALAALPVFMLWVFISWLIVLWGATFCMTLQSEQRQH